MEPLWCIGGDRRMLYTVRALRENGRSVQTYGVPELDDAPLPERISLLVLPFPSFLGGTLRAQNAIDAEALVRRTGAGSAVFGGLFGQHRAAFEARGAEVIELYGSEPLTTENAVLTAEGAIGLAIAHSPFALHGAQCLVIGCGRIGKALAARLHALHTNVTVAARSAADLAYIEAGGMRAEKTGLYRHGLGDYRFVFNTVPATVLTREQLAAVSPDCLLLELASKPFGFSVADCRALGLHARSAPSLPASFAAASAGAAYADSILRALQARERNDFS